MKDLKDIFFGFRCPHCAEATVLRYQPTEDVFSAAGDCGHCAVIAERFGDKLKLTVPCVTCSTPHRYTVGEAMLRREGGLSLPCAYSGVDCFFAGSREEVEEAMTRSDEEIRRVLSLEEKVRGDDTVEKTLGLDTKEGAVIDSTGAAEVAFYNPEIAAEMLFLIKDMACDGKIRCSCGNTDVTIRVATEEIRFLCPACQRFRIFYSRSVSDRARLEELSEIVIL